MSQKSTDENGRLRRFTRKALGNCVPHTCGFKPRAERTLNRADSAQIELYLMKNDPTYRANRWKDNPVVLSESAHSPKRKAPDMETVKRVQARRRAA